MTAILTEPSVSSVAEVRHLVDVVRCGDAATLRAASRDAVAAFEQLSALVDDQLAARRWGGTHELCAHIEDAYRTWSTRHRRSSPLDAWSMRWHGALAFRLDVKLREVRNLATRAAARA